MLKLGQIIAISLCAMLNAGSALAVATVPTQVPEPGLLGLFAAGVVAVILLKHGNRN